MERGIGLLRSPTASFSRIIRPQTLIPSSSVSFSGPVQFFATDPPFANSYEDDVSAVKRPLATFRALLFGLYIPLFLPVFMLIVTVRAVDPPSPSAGNFLRRLCGSARSFENRVCFLQVSLQNAYNRRVPSVLRLPACLSMKPVLGPSPRSPP
jgi:hypothetical protein